MSFRLTHVLPVLALTVSLGQWAHADPTLIAEGGAKPGWKYAFVTGCSEPSGTEVLSYQIELTTLGRQAKKVYRASFVERTASGKGIQMEALIPIECLIQFESNDAGDYSPSPSTDGSKLLASGGAKEGWSYLMGSDCAGSAHSQKVSAYRLELVDFGGVELYRLTYDTLDSTPSHIVLIMPTSCSIKFEKASS